MRTAALLLTLPLAWNPSPNATGYRVWRGIELVAETRGTEARVLVPAGESSTLTVTALNAAGQSPHSQPLTVWIPPTPSLTIQGSGDLAAWHDVPLPGDRFFRIKIER